MKTADSGFCGEDTLCLKLWRIFMVENVDTADIRFSFLDIIIFVLQNYFFCGLKKIMLIKKTCIYKI